MIDRDYLNSWAFIWGKTMNQPAVILLVFANDESQPLNELAKELDTLRSLLRHGLQQYVDGRGRKQFEIITLTYSSISSLFDELRHYRNRIAMMHFAGHTDSTLWRLNEEAIHAQGIADILRLQQSLRFLFLNGCDNAEQVRLFASAGIPAVIATSAPVNDQTARQFSIRFYEYLLENDLNTSLTEAFELAKAEIQENDGQEQRYRTLHYKKTLPTWSWQLTETVHKSAEWCLADLLRDGCFGLPKLPSDLPLPARPFKNIHYFTEKDAPVFFGRCREISRAYSALTNQVHETEAVHLLYGSTGVGKSSFLSAGLIPYLKIDDYQTIYFRYDEKQGIREAFYEMFQEIHQGKNDPENINFLSLWMQKERKEGKPLIIILDQLENIFTHHVQDDEFAQTKQVDHAEFLNLLDIVRHTFYQDDKPEGKLVLSFRKEWLADVLNGFEEKDIIYGKIILEQLDSQAIIDAIEGIIRNAHLQQRYKLRIDNPDSGRLSEIIATELLVSRQGIAPTLQILLSKMWREVEHYEEPTFDLALYKKLWQKGELIERHLQQQIEEIGQIEPWGAEAKASGLILDVLYAHTTGLGTAGELTQAAYESRYAHISYRQELINELKKRFLIVDFQKDNMIIGSPSFTRLTHDTLAALVRDRFRQSLLSGQRARRILNNYNQYDDCHLLNKNDLQMVLAGELGTYQRSREEDAWVKRSRRHQGIIKGLVVSGIASIFLLAGLSVFQWQQAHQQKQEVLVAKEDSERLIKRMVSLLSDLEPNREGVKVAKGIYQSIKNNFRQGHSLSDKQITLAINERLYGGFLSANAENNEALMHFTNSVRLLEEEVGRIKHDPYYGDQKGTYIELGLSDEALYHQYKKNLKEEENTLEEKKVIQEKMQSINKRRVFVYNELLKLESDNFAWRRGKLLALIDSGDTERYRNDLQKARDYYKQSDQLLIKWTHHNKEHEYLKGHARLLASWGSYYRDRKDMKKSYEYYQNSLNIATALSKKEPANTRLKIGRISIHYKIYRIKYQQKAYRKAYEHIAQAKVLLENLEEFGRLTETHRCWLKKDQHIVKALEKGFKQRVKTIEVNEPVCEKQLVARL